MTTPLPDLAAAVAMARDWMAQDPDPVTRAALGAESGMYGALAMISDTVSQMS